MEPSDKASEAAQYLYDQWYKRANAAVRHGREIALQDAFFRAIDTVARAHQGIHVGVVIAALESLAEHLKEDLRQRFDHQTPSDDHRAFLMIPPDA